MSPPARRPSSYTSWFVAAVAACSMSGALASTAGAATAGETGSRLVYTAAPGETNSLTISAGAGGITLNDGGATITPGAGCTGGAQTVTCDATKVALIVVDAGDGNDTVGNSTATPSRISGGPGNDHLTGGSGNDTLIGNQGVDTLDGAAGDDTLVSRGDVADVDICGAGNDTVEADASDHVASDCETVLLPGQTAPPPSSGPGGPGPAPSPPAQTVAAGSPLPPAGLATPSLPPCVPAHIAAVAMLFGTLGNDAINGTLAGDVILGLGGDDTIHGLQGDDCLYGGDGADRLLGDAGVDVLQGENGNDALYGGLGADRLYGAAGDDRLSGGDGSDVIFGGPGSDQLFGGPGNDVLKGGDGNDVISAGQGSNRVIAGAGNDRIDVRNGRRDVVDCGPGRDTVTADRIDGLRHCERVRRAGARRH